MSSLMPFYFEQHTVRVVMRDGEPWFVAGDIAKVLGHATAKDAVRILDEDEKGGHSMPTPGGPQEVTIISEPGLYRLLMRSDKPQAHPFQKWVAGAVLPEIRRTGSFNGSKDRLPTHLETAEALVEALRRNQKLEAQAKADAPKVEFHDRFVSATGHFTVQEAAKAFGTGEIRLFRELKARGYLMLNRLPYQQWVDRGWFLVIPKTGHWQGKEHTYRVTVVTPLGMSRLSTALRDWLPVPVHQPALPEMEQPKLLI